jgi:hypothetical protein
MSKETKTLDVSAMFQNSSIECPIKKYTMVGNGTGVAILTGKTLKIDLSTEGTTEFEI